MAPQYKLSDSESDAEPDTSTNPSDNQLEQGLRDEVAGIFKSDNMDELTVKRIRSAVEKKLGLTEGYFKNTGDWKSRSEKIIKAEVVRYLQFNWRVIYLFMTLTCDLHDLGRAGECAER